jgi:uncharacterized protein (DUF433 family)
MAGFDQLVGIGLYTPAEAARLTGVPATKIVRWLRGHSVAGRHYGALWQPQVNIGDNRVYLGFRDLMEVRVADAFISRNLSPQKVRRAIEIASELIGDERPLSTRRFRTGGRTVFLQVAREDDADELIDLFKRQYAFLKIIEPSLSTIDFDGAGLPARWWPMGKRGHIVVDPARAFGQPIEAASGVPAATLAAAVEAEGSAEAAASLWAVPINSVRRALEFQGSVERRLAA